MSLLLAVPNKYHNTMSSLRTYNGLDQIQRQNASKAPFLCVDPESHTVFIRDDDQMLKSRIKQVMELTNKSSDEVAVALHDADNDINRAVNILLETSTETVHQNEWKITSSRKKRTNQNSENNDNTKIKTPDSINQKSSKNSSSDLAKVSISKTKITNTHKDEETKINKNNTTDISSNKELSKSGTTHNNDKGNEIIENRQTNNVKVDHPKFSKRFPNERPRYVGKDDLRNTLPLSKNSKESLDEKGIYEPASKAPNRNFGPHRPGDKPFTRPPFARHAQFRNIPNNKTDGPFNTNPSKSKPFMGPSNFRFNKFNGERTEMPNQFGFKRSLPFKDDRSDSKSFLDTKNQRDNVPRRGSFHNRFPRGSYGPHRPGFRRGMPAERRHPTSRSPTKSKPSKDVVTEESEKWAADKMDSVNWKEPDIEKPFWNQDSFGEWAEVANKELSKHGEKQESVEDFASSNSKSSKETNYNTISKSIDISELLGTSVTHTIKNVSSSYPISTTISDSNRQASEAIKNAIGVGIQASPSPKKASDYGRPAGIEITEFGPNSPSKNVNASNIKSKLPPLSKIPTIPVVMPDNNVPSPKQNYQFGSEFEFGSIEIQDVPASFKDSGHDSCTDRKGITTSPKKPFIDQNQNREVRDTEGGEEGRGQNHASKITNKDQGPTVASHKHNDSRPYSNYKPTRNDSSTFHRKYETNAGPRNSGNTGGNNNNNANGPTNRSNSFSRPPHHNYNNQQQGGSGGAYRPPPHNYYGNDPNRPAPPHESKWRSSANPTPAAQGSGLKNYHSISNASSCDGRPAQQALANVKHPNEQRLHEAPKQTAARSPERHNAVGAPKPSHEEARDASSPVIITSSLPSSIAPLSSTLTTQLSTVGSSTSTSSGPPSVNNLVSAPNPSTLPNAGSSHSGSSISAPAATNSGNYNGSSQKATPVPSLATTTISNVNRAPANFSPAFTPLLSHQYALGQALGLPYFPPPVYTYEDLQLLQRFPMAGFYDLSTQLSAAAAASALQQQQQQQQAHGMGSGNAAPNSNLHPNTNLVSSLLGGAPQPNHHQHPPNVASFMGPPATLGSQHAHPGPGTQGAPPYPPSFLYGAGNNNHAGGANQNSNNQQQQQQQQQLLMMNHLLPGMMNSLFVGTTGGPAGGGGGGTMSNNGAAPPSTSGKQPQGDLGKQQQQLSYHNQMVPGPSPLLQMDSGALHKYNTNAPPAPSSSDKRRLQQLQGQQQQHTIGHVGAAGVESQDYLAAFQQAQQAAALVAAAQQQQQQQPFVASTNPAAFAAGMGYYYPGGLIPGALPQYPLTAVFPSVGGVQSSNNVPVYQKNHLNATGSYGGNYYTGAGVSDSQAAMNDSSARTYQKQNLGMASSGKQASSSHHNSGMTGPGVGGGGGVKQHSTQPASNNSGGVAQQQSRNSQNPSNNNNNPEDGSIVNSNCPKPQSSVGLVGGDKNVGTGAGGMVGLNAYDILAALQQQQQQGATSTQHSDDNNGLLSGSAGVGGNNGENQHHQGGGGDKYNNGRSQNHYVHGQLRGKLHGGSGGPQGGLTSNNAFGSSPPQGNAMFAQQQQPQRNNLPAGQYNSGGGAGGYHHQNHMPSGTHAGFQRMGVEGLGSSNGGVMVGKGMNNPYHHAAHQQQTVSGYNPNQHHQTNSGEAANHAGYWN